MKTKFLLFALLTTGSVAYAEDVSLEKCPSPVQQTIQANLRAGQLEEVEVIKVDGRSLYVAEIERPTNQDLKLHVAEDGKLLKTSEDLEGDEIPDRIKDAVAKLIVANGELDDVDREVADGKTTYHVEIDRKNAPDLDVVIAEDGTVISQTEEIGS